MESLIGCLSNWSVLDEIASNSEYLLEIETNLMIFGISHIELSQFSGFIKTKKETSKYILRGESDIYEFLAIHDYKTHHLVKTNSGKDYVSFKDQIIHVYEEVKGTLLNVSHVLQDDQLIKMIGSNLGRLDQLLKSSDISEQIQNAPGIQSWELVHEIPRIRQYIESNIPQYVDLLDELYKALQEVVFNVLPKQLIHRDYHIGNLIQSVGGIYLIDFDQTCLEIRLFELCYFLTTSFF